MNDAKYILRDYQIQKESISFLSVCFQSLVFVAFVGSAGALLLALSVV